MLKQVDNRIVDTDYVKNGVLYIGYTYNGNVQIEAETDLPELAGQYKPGALAHLPGWVDGTWELAADGTWEPVIGGN